MCSDCHGRLLQTRRRVYWSPAFIWDPGFKRFTVYLRKTKMISLRHDIAVLCEQVWWLHSPSSASSCSSCSDNSRATFGSSRCLEGPRMRKESVKSERYLGSWRVVLRSRKHCRKTKMWFMYSLSWVATVVQICFVTLAIGKFCINSGLIM